MQLLQLLLLLRAPPPSLSLASSYNGIEEGGEGPGRSHGQAGQEKIGADVQLEATFLLGRIGKARLGRVRGTNEDMSTDSFFLK